MNFILASLLSLSLWCSSTPVDADVALSETVRVSLSRGNAHQLSAYFSKTLQLVIDPVNVEFQSVQAAQAEQILRSFFKRYPPHHFSFVYRGQSSRLRYSTGVYETDGQAFTVYVLMRQSSNRQFQINAIHFRKE
jgi:hypothetical protein